MQKCGPCQNSCPKTGKIRPFLVTGGHERADFCSKSASGFGRSEPCLEKAGGHGRSKLKIFLAGITGGRPISLLDESNVKDEPQTARTGARTTKTNVPNELGVTRQRSLEKNHCSHILELSRTGESRTQ